MANEKRLIDANALLEKIQYRLPFKDLVAEMINEILEVIRKQIVEAPTVDAVEVVRCKDCKYRYTAKSGLILCTQHITMTPKEDDFCSYGERREGE